MPAILGLLAGILTTIAPLIQAVKTVRSKSIHDLSLGMWLAQTMGNVLWLIYGCVIRSGPVIIANAVTVLCAATVLSVIVVNRGQKRSAS